MKREKTNDEIVDEIAKGIKEAETEEDRKKSLKENLWDDVEMMADISEMLNRISMYLREYESKRMDVLKEEEDEL